MGRINFSCYILLVLVVFSSCVTPKNKANHSDINTEWLSEWLDMFFIEYREYKVSALLNCSDADRDIAYDIERKIRAVSKVKIKNQLDFIDNYLAARDLKYDSLLIEHIHSPIYESEYSTTPVYFSIFVKGEKLDFEGYLPPNEIVTELPEVGVEELGSGCGYGFLSSSIFYSSHKFYIKKIVINPSAQ